MEMTAIFVAVAAGSAFVAGELAKRRGRSLKIWVWISVMIGPLAIPLLFLLPRKHVLADGPA